MNLNYTKYEIIYGSALLLQDLENNSVSLHDYVSDIPDSYMCGDTS